MDGWEKIAGLILSGAGIGGVLTFLIQSRRLKQEGLIQLLETYRKDLIEYKEDVKELRKEVQTLRLRDLAKQKEIDNLRNQLAIFEGSHGDVPVPLWLKDTKGTMLFLNEEYERVILQPIGKTAEDYIGHTDFKIWDKSVAEQFRANDAEVMRKKGAVEFIETWEGPSGITYSGNLIKYPRYDNMGGRRTVIGIGGIITNMKRAQDANS